MKNILLDFWNFIKNPKDERYLGNDNNYKWKVLFHLFVFNIFISIVYVGIFTFLDTYLHLEHKLEEINLAFIPMIFMIAIFIPFIEEVVFRLGLRRKGVVAQIFTESSWKKWFPIFVYSSTIIFALVHITNYKFNNYFYLLLAPLLTLSQFVSGFIMTYLRVRFNFWMGFAFHTLWNFLAVIVMVQNIIFQPEQINIKNDRYELEVTHSDYFFNSNQSLSFFSRNDTIYEMDAKGFTLENVLKFIDTTNIEYKPLVKKIDIKFHSKNGIIMDSLYGVLEKEGYIEKRTSTD